ncbi:MAG: hypothetical protein IIB07_06930 [Bacteroidetes bacterium]|nr:hypothetical protein [Bacteroidota bacterium]
MVAAAIAAAVVSAGLQVVGGIQAQKAAKKEAELKAKEKENKDNSQDKK